MYIVLCILLLAVCKSSGVIFIHGNKYCFTYIRHLDEHLARIIPVTLNCHTLDEHQTKCMMNEFKEK